MRRRVTIAFLFLVFIALNAAAQGHGDMFGIAMDVHEEGWPQAAYAFNEGVYLVVWEDYRGSDSDIYGQFVNDNGTLRGNDFAICTAAGHQYWPRLDYDMANKRFFVVFEDHRNSPDSDIRGVFVNTDGTFYVPSNAEADNTLLINSNPESIYTCSVAFNPLDHNYLVVWGDYRNDPGRWPGDDVFGQLVDQDGTLLPPPDPADSATNFPIAESPDFFESVADVTWHPRTGEFFVVYGTDIGYVLGQRVDGEGNLINPDGTVVTKPGSWGSAIQCSDYFDNGPDCLQPRVKANCEYQGYMSVWYECEVVWRGNHLSLGMGDNDVWGQRIGFFWDGQKYVAERVDLGGDITPNVSNHPISLQDGACGAPEIDFSLMDNEFLVAWGDPRNDPNNYSAIDLYYQRLIVTEVQGAGKGTGAPKYVMELADDDRVNIVTEYENIPIFTTSNYEGSLIGIAHSNLREEFLVAFTYEDHSMGRSGDVMGVIAKGTPPVGVEDTPSIPEIFEVHPNYPNPFNPETTIRFSLPEKSGLRVAVYDLMGRKVRTLMEGIKPADRYSVVWDGTDDAGNAMVSGVYFYEVRTDGDVVTKKMSLIR